VRYHPTINENKVEYIYIYVFCYCCFSFLCDSQRTIPDLPDTIAEIEARYESLSESIGVGRLLAKHTVHTDPQTDDNIYFSVLHNLIHVRRYIISMLYLSRIHLFLSDNVI